MKVDTVQQFYVLKYLEQQFYIEELKLTLMDRYTIRVQDVNSDIMELYWDIGDCTVKYRDI